MATFYDFSPASAVPYPGGGYCLDRLRYDTTPRHLRQAAAGSDEGGGAAAAGTSSNGAGAGRRDARSAGSDPVALWRRWVPPSLRKRVPSSWSSFVRRHLPDSPGTRG